MKEKKDNLVMSPVQFNEDGHTYTLSGHSLQGVTPIIAWLFPETYKGIPQNVLDAAAEYGSMVHAKCELADSLGIVDSDPVRAYMELKEQKGLTTLCNEYLVSDEHRVASKIDVLTTDYDIIDIKTTSKVHIQHVTLQTSIYAWLFERQNDGKTAGQLYCLWLPKPQYGQPDIITLQRVPSSICEQIVDLYFSGAQPIQARALLAAVGFEVSDEKKAGDVPDELESMMDELITISYNVMRILLVGYVAMEIIQCLSGVMRGAGDTMTPMWISMITTIVLRIPVAYGMAYFTASAAWPNGHPFSLSTSLLISWTMGAVISFVAYRKGKWRKKAHLSMGKDA